MLQYFSERIVLCIH